MTADNVQSRQKPLESDGSTISGLVDQLRRFDGSAEQFLVDLLAIQCFLGRADSGAILRDAQGQGLNVLAVYPSTSPEEAAPEWLAKSTEFVREAISADEAVIRPLPKGLAGYPARSYIVSLPLKIVDTGRAVEVFLIRANNRASLKMRQQQLELSVGLLGIAEKRLALVANRKSQIENRKSATHLKRLKRAMETLCAVNRQNRFKGTAMALCNEVASQWQCERVSVGLLKGRYVELKAMSHSEHFSRKMRLIQDIESAMEECLDQDCEIIHPASPQASYISRATSELSAKQGPGAILSLPLRLAGEVCGVLTLERPAERPFNLEEVEAIRLTCDLCTPRLLSLYEHDRWVGARAKASARRVLAALVGPEHTWAKVLAILLFVVILFLVFAKGQFRAEAPFVLEATYQQTICAPFDGFIKAVNVEVGDAVEQGKTTLAELDTAELRLQLAAAKADRAGYLTQFSAAMRDGETAQAQIAQAKADKVEAQIELFNYLIDQAKLVSPIDGTVVKGDLKRQIGAPVKTGDVLFEVTPLESLRAELLLPEDEIFDVAVGQHGYLATASYPTRRIEFVVERINPAAEVVDNRNVFKVRARLAETRGWMRPGMEGVAKVTLGKRRYAWIWTRKIVNWFRMTFWI